MRTTFKIAFIIFTVLLTASLHAQGSRGGGQRGGRGQGGNQQRNNKPDATEVFSKLDTNNDGVIDKDEASADERGKIAEVFEEIDTNSDDVIDLDELKASLNDRKKPKKIFAEKVLKEVDDNEDGSLNELEIAAKNKRDLIENFQKIDANQDSELDLEELKTFYNNIASSKRKKRDN